MKFLLVNPACQDLRVTDNDSQMVPIGLYYLAAQLMDHGHTAPILNLAGQDAAAAAREQEKGADPQPGTGPDQPVSLASLTRLFARVAAREKPDVIGFSVTNPARRCAMACARAARTVLPHALILFGGPAPTFMAPHLFKACPELDIAVRGEGELTLLALAQLLDRHPWPAPSPETPEKNTA